MNIDFNRDEIMGLKYDAAEKIHELLKTSIKKMGNKCKRCGEKLEWNFKYKICESCHGVAYDGAKA